MGDFVVVLLSNSIVVGESKALYEGVDAYAVGTSTSCSKQDLPILVQLML